MTEPVEQLAHTLKLHGYSLTTPRRIIFEALQDKEPQTMHELVAVCGQAVDRASIYRTTALFEQLGIMQRLHIGWKYKLELSGQFHHHHHHLSCSQCGRIIVLPEDSAIEHHLNALATAHGFKPTDHQLEIRGKCADCQRNIGVA